MAVSKRQHFIAQFYQRSFADPMFSDNVRVYEANTRSWNDKRRTPQGIGWFPHLYNVIGEDGKRKDAFEQFLQKEIDGKAALAMKKAARGPQSLNADEREAVALFIGFAAARTPGIMHPTQDDSLANLPAKRSEELNEMAREWCESISKPYTEDSVKEFLKPSLLKALFVSAISMRDRLLSFRWKFLRTTADQPFVTSDWPVFADLDPATDLRLVCFPISSECALIATNGELKSQLKGTAKVEAINRQTLSRATEFVICRQSSFPGDADLTEWPFSDASRIT